MNQMHTKGDNYLVQWPTNKQTTEGYVDSLYFASLFPSNPKVDRPIKLQFPGGGA